MKTTSQYDLKHQVECLNDVFKHEKCVDRFDTDMSMIFRVLRNCERTRKKECKMSEVICSGYIGCPEHGFGILQEAKEQP